jgi:hypothetical protein
LRSVIGTDNVDLAGKSGHFGWGDDVVAWVDAKYFYGVRLLAGRLGFPEFVRDQFDCVYKYEVFW